MHIHGNVYCNNCSRHVFNCICKKHDESTPVPVENKMVDPQYGKNESSKQVIKK